MSALGIGWSRCEKTPLDPAITGGAVAPVSPPVMAGFDAALRVGWLGKGFPLRVGRAFEIVIERDEEGFYVASVPELHGCHTQAQSLDAPMERIREAIELCVEVQ
jgi:hypothetical protein